jgi:hypothetical protein
MLPDIIRFTRELMKLTEESREYAMGAFYALNVEQQKRPIESARWLAERFDKQKEATND